MPLTAATVDFDANVSGTGWHTLIDPPDAGTSILLYAIQILNGAWAANDVRLRLYNDLTTEIFELFYNTAMPGLNEGRVPTRGKEGPIIFESGWRLQAYSSTISVAGLHVLVNYGIDTGYGDQPSDYHASHITCDAAAGVTALPALAEAPEHKIRHIKSVALFNGDSISHAMWSLTRDPGGANPAYVWNMTNLAALTCVHFPYVHEGITIDENRELAIQKGTADTAGGVKVWVSYMEAGGYEHIGPSDTGPWTKSQQIIQRRSINLDGQLDRLMTYPTPAAQIGIADQFTLLVWTKPYKPWQPNQEWIFMLGGLSNSGAIFLSRNTDPAAGGPNAPYEIEIHDSSATKKLYRWGPTLTGGYWECAAVTFDGSASEPYKLQCWKNGSVYVWPLTLNRVIDLAIGTLTDTTRYMGLGGAPTLGTSNTDGFYGRIWAAAAWSRVLGPAEIQYLSDPYNSHYDLRLSHGPYVASSALEHYYRPGLQYSPNMGKDYGLGGNLTDLTFENHVSNADLVDDFPGKGLI